MRIAVAVHGYPPAGRGGVEQVAAEQAEALVARGHEVAVFARESSADRPEGATRDEVVGRVRVRRVVVHDGARPSFAGYYEGAFLDAPFRSFLGEVQPDVLHVQHLATLSNRLAAIAREARVATVLSLHDAYYLCHRLFLLDVDGRRCPGPDAGLRCVACLAEHGVGDRVRERFDAMARLLASVDAVVAPSPSLRRRYEEQLPFLDGRIEVVEPGLARVPPVAPGTGQVAGSPGAPGTGRVAGPPGAAEEGAVAGPLRLLFIGTLLPHKGLDLLVDALEGLPTAPFTLTVYGEEVEAGAAWVEALRRRTAGRPVVWGGSFAPLEIDSVFAAADVLVLPSRCDEAWSRVVREARAAGLAVVAPNVGGPADWLRDGEDALLVEPDCAKALRAALARLAADRDLLATLRRPETTVPGVDDAAARLEEIFAGVVDASRTTSAPARPRVSVAYVTRDGAPWIEESLRAVRRQTGAFDLAEILAIDSGSRDGTVALLERHGARVVRIEPASFGHGRTRNLAVREARGDLVAFLTQDAAPADERWLDGLVRALQTDPLCAAAWSRHLPRDDCHPMERRMLAEHPPFREDAAPIQTARGNPDYARDPDAQCSLSNNAAAYRRDLLLRRPFPDVRFAEDRSWARARLEEGWRTVLVRDSLVRHSHSYSPWVNLRRNFDHFRTMAEDLGYTDDFSLADGWRASFLEMRRDVAFRARETGGSKLVSAARWALPAILYHLGAFTGRWLGAHADRLPAGVPDRLSMHVASGVRERRR